MTTLLQGGLTLARVLTLLKQAIAALLHLHSLGILHRDLRAANILIDGLDPLRVLVADFGVSHLLSSFASGEVHKGASKIESVLTGTAALGPLQVRASTLTLKSHESPPPPVSFRVLLVSTSYPGYKQWTAPEVRAGSEARGRVVSTASDVYMVGGFAFELLTAGTPPFHWLARNAQLLFERLTSADPVEIPGTDMEVPGLLHKNVLEAADLDRKPIPWCVQADATPGSGNRLEELRSLMRSCWALNPEDRPKLPDLHRSVTALHVAEATEVRATGSAAYGPTSAGSSGPSAPASQAGMCCSMALQLYGCPYGRTVLFPGP